MRVCLICFHFYPFFLPLYCVCVNSGSCLYSICVCTLHNCPRSPQDRNKPPPSLLSQPNSLRLLAFSITCFPFTCMHIYTHTHQRIQLIRGQKRVTFAYLVSRVTRKKLSSGASIQLGRLLRIITPPRVFPLLLLRPLCCRKTITYSFITSRNTGGQDFFKKGGG